jgi:hypothetical protein
VWVMGAKGMGLSQNSPSPIYPRSCLPHFHPIPHHGHIPTFPIWSDLGRGSSTTRGMCGLYVGRLRGGFQVSLQPSTSPLNSFSFLHTHYPTHNPSHDNPTTTHPLNPDFQNQKEKKLKTLAPSPYFFTPLVHYPLPISIVQKICLTRWRYILCHSPSYQ